MVSAAFPAFMPGPSVGFGKDGIVLVCQSSRSRRATPKMVWRWTGETKGRKAPKRSGPDERVFRDPLRRRDDGGSIGCEWSDGLLGLLAGSAAGVRRELAPLRRGLPLGWIRRRVHRP